MTITPFPIKQATTLDLTFDESKKIFSNNYSDIYFQPNIGLEEKTHVFLNGNGLPKNWLNKEQFTIAETGFGTGLNFLNTIKKWTETSHTNQHLNYISCELHPLNLIQLQKALQQFPQLHFFSQLLIDNYPENLFYGIHRLHFQTQRTTLTLVIGDAHQGLNQLNAKIDAWYLDGFAPSKNPQLWSKKLFKIISELSHQGTTLATYTVARKIRDSLQANGFNLEKVKGFGQKREMLTAYMNGVQKNQIKQPWAQTFKARKTKSYTIIGAGIAGLSLAQKMCDAGKNVTLIDRQLQPCQETSGNPQAMVMPSFTLNDSIESRFYLSAFLYAINHYSSEVYNDVGVYQLAFTDKQKTWQNKLLINFDLPHSLVKKHQEGLLYSSAGWLNTQLHTHKTFTQLSEKKHFNYMQASIDSIEYKNNQWQLIQNDSLAHTTNALVLANGIGIKQLLNKYELPITPKHGQISYFKSSKVTESISQSPHIQLCKGYITPNWYGNHTIGATFDHLDEKKWFKPPQSTDNHWQRNKELWKGTPFEKTLATIEPDASRAGIRVTTPDHMPICGAIIDQLQFKEDYHDIKHGKIWKHYPAPKHINNLYVFTGLGSRGFTSAPILSESLCNQILGNPQVLPNELQKAINPNRFLYKTLKKK